MSRITDVADMLWRRNEDSVAGEAAVLLRQFEKIQRLHERSVCTRARRLISRAYNALALAIARRRS